MNILQSINQIIKKEPFNYETKNELKQCAQANKRAQINSIGQLQIRAISASGNAQTSVNKPMTQQRPKNLIEDLGIKYMGELSSNFVYPIIDGNASQWATEFEEASVNTTEFKSIALQPKRNVTYVEYSKDVILNPSTDVANAIQEDLLNAVFEKVQGTMFNDIVDTANTISISGCDDIIDFEYSASTQNISNSVYLVSPNAARALKKMKNGDTPIYLNGMINGCKVYETPSLTGNTIILGDFTKLLLAQWGSFDIVVDDVTMANKGIVRLIINSYWNWDKIDNNAFIFGKTE